MTISPIAIIILAAGESTRMRLPKQLLPYKRKSLLQRAVDEALASKAQSVHVVLGAHADQIRRSVSMDNVTVVLNEKWGEGMSSSIRAGVGALRPDIEAAMIALCDQPYLSSTVINELIDRYLASGKPIVACEYDGLPGVPALFAKRYFTELTSLRGDSGARRIIQSHENDALLIPFSEGSVDLDTPEEYRSFIERSLKNR